MNQNTVKKQLRAAGAEPLNPMTDEHERIYAYFCLVELGNLQQAAYQRGVSMNHVAKLKGRFNYKACNPLNASLRDKALWNFDGGHRQELLLQLGYGDHYAIVHVGLNYDEEAQLFYELNDAPRRMYGWTTFKAAYNAGNTTHGRLIEIADKFKLTTPMTPGITRVSEADIKSPIYLIWPLSKGGYPLVEAVCKVLDKCWRYGNRKTAVQAEAKETSIIRGLAMFLKAHYLNGELPWNTIQMVLKNIGPAGLTEQAKLAPVKRIDQRQYADALCTLFGVDAAATNAPNCHLRRVA